MVADPLGLPDKDHKEQRTQHRRKQEISGVEPEGEPNSHAQGGVGGATACAKGMQQQRAGQQQEEGRGSPLHSDAAEGDVPAGRSHEQRRGNAHPRAKELSPHDVAERDGGNAR